MGEHDTRFTNILATDGARSESDGKQQQTRFKHFIKAFITAPKIPSYSPKKLNLKTNYDSLKSIILKSKP